MKLKKHIKRVIFLSFIIGAVFIFFSCNTVSIPYQQQNYPNHPHSILIMPVINQSFDLSAEPTFLATSAAPLAQAGYYVLPVTLTMEMFRQNGITVAEEAHAIPHTRLHEIFGADAAIYITVTRFGPEYAVIASGIVIEANARLVDLRSGRILWSGYTIQMETTSGPSDFSALGILSAVLDATVSQVINVLSPERSLQLTRRANQILFHPGESSYSIKYGPYSPNFGQDEEDEEQEEFY